MNSEPLHLLLADDDEDDCMFFEEVLKELPFSADLTVVHDGEKLMQHLATQTAPLPEVLFLDLNIPRKNGIECLSEIKNNKDLKQLFVIIFSTSSEQDIVNRLYLEGAHHFIRKPAEFSQLKKVIQQALTIILERPSVADPRAGGNSVLFKQPPRETFVLTGFDQ